MDYALQDAEGQANNTRVRVFQQSQDIGQGCLNGGLELRLILIRLYLKEYILDSLSPLLKRALIINIAEHLSKVHARRLLLLPFLLLLLIRDTLLNFLQSSLIG